MIFILGKSLAITKQGQMKNFRSSIKGVQNRILFWKLAAMLSVKYIIPCESLITETTEFFGKMAV